MNKKSLLASIMAATIVVAPSTTYPTSVPLTSSITVSAAYSSGSKTYTKTVYAAKSSSGIIYAKDVFKFSVDKKGKISLKSVTQKSFGYPSYWWNVVENKGTSIRVVTCWGSNASLPIPKTKIKTPVLKKVYCYYTIRNNGSVILDYKCY